MDKLFNETNIREKWKKENIGGEIGANLQKEIFGNEEYISKIFLFNFIINEKFLIIK